jgi:aminomethyltransferase
MPVAAATPGTALTVRNADGTEIKAIASDMPFYDLDKSIRTAKG